MIYPTNCCPMCGHEKEEKVTLGDLEVHYSPTLVFYKGERVKLSPAETRVLYNLVRRGRQSYDSLAILPNGDYSDNLSIRIRISKIRSMLKANNIPIVVKNIHSYGYEVQKVDG